MTAVSSFPLSPALAIAHFSLIYWSEEKEETACNLFHQFKLFPVKGQNADKPQK